MTGVQTPENATLWVPNSELATSAVTNMTSEDPQGIVHEFGVDYGENVDRADRRQRVTVKSQFLRAVHERFRAAGIDLTETSQHDLSGTVHVAGVDGPERSLSGGSA